MCRSALRCVFLGRGASENIVPVAEGSDLPEFSTFDPGAVRRCCPHWPSRWVDWLVVFAPIAAIERNARPKENPAACAGFRGLMRRHSWQRSNRASRAGHEPPAAGGRAFAASSSARARSISSSNATRIGLADSWRGTRTSYRAPVALCTITSAGVRRSFAARSAAGSGMTSTRKKPLSALPPSRPRPEEMLSPGCTFTRSRRRWPS